MAMGIPVEQIGSERQRIPAVLVSIDKTVGSVKYSANHDAVKIPLSDLQLAPEAFSSVPDDECSHSESLCNENHKRTTSKHVFSPRDPVEIWLDSGTTLKAEKSSEKFTGPSGAWWPGRVLTIQSGFAHVEVAAPLIDNSGDEKSTFVMPHLVGSSLLPYRSALVKIEEIRRPWNGRGLSDNAMAAIKDLPQHGAIGNLTPNFMKESSFESASLLSPGVLHRHTICIPAYLSKLSSSPDSHSVLTKFCGAPCLIQCDSEPFLAGLFAKIILGNREELNNSDIQTPNHVASTDTGSISPSFSFSTYVWPSAAMMAQSTLMSPPNLVGTLSPFGITDPGFLLAGLPGADGPLVLLHIWSGSSEAIRRATFLELGHVRLLAVRYHLLQNFSKGEVGELDLSTSSELKTENGDSPPMHCKPISLPVPASNDKPNSSGGFMVGYECSFRIVPRLIGLAIGHKGATIQQARGLPGVRAVFLLPNGIVRVRAETIEACHSVRNLLDFTEAEIPVPPRLASRLIGSKGMNIRKLADSAGVRQALLLDPRTRKLNQLARQRQLSASSEHESSSTTTNEDVHEIASNGDALEATEVKTTVDTDNLEHKKHTVNTNDLPSPAFYLLGTRSSVAKMRLLLEFQADNWNELDELEETRRSLFSQLRQSNQPIRNPNSVSPGRLNNNRPVRSGMPPVNRGAVRGRRTQGKQFEQNDEKRELNSNSNGARGRIPNGKVSDTELHSECTDSSDKNGTLMTNGSNGHDVDYQTLNNQLKKKSVTNKSRSKLTAH